MTHNQSIISQPRKTPNALLSLAFLAVNHCWNLEVARNDWTMMGNGEARGFLVDDEGSGMGGSCGMCGCPMSQYHILSYPLKDRPVHQLQLSSTDIHTFVFAIEVLGYLYC
jgi:hypothetical protein